MKMKNDKHSPAKSQGVCVGGPGERETELERENMQITCAVQIAEWNGFYLLFLFFAS